MEYVLYSHIVIHHLSWVFGCIWWIQFYDSMAVERSKKTYNMFVINCEQYDMFMFIPSSFVLWTTVQPTCSNSVPPPPIQNREYNWRKSEIGRAVERVFEHPGIIIYRIYKMRFIHPYDVRISAAADFRLVRPKKPFFREPRTHILICGCISPTNVPVLSTVTDGGVNIGILGRERER